MGLNSRLLRALVVVAACVGVGVFAVSCQPSDSAQRLAEVETSIKGVSQIATRVNSLEGKEEGTAGQVASLTQAVTDLSQNIEALRKDVEAAQSADSSVKKKLDALSSQVSTLSTKLGSVEQKVSLLETRYNDHLRKYHSGG